MQNRIHHESIAVRRERKLVQADFSNAQVTTLVAILADLVTKKEFSEFRNETRDRFVRIETKLDNTETKEEIAGIQAKLDNTATKDDLNEKHFQLLVLLPIITTAIVGVMLAFGAYLVSLLI